MSVLAISFGDHRVADALPWTGIADAPSGCTLLLFCAETQEFAVGEHMTSMVDGDRDWIIARGFNEQGEQVAFRFKPSHWTWLPRPPVSA